MKKITIISSALFGVVFLTGCVINKPASQIQSTTSTPTVQQPATSIVQPTDETKDWPTFTHKKYNYIFKYPQSGEVVAKAMAPYNLYEVPNIMASYNNSSFNVEAQDFEKFGKDALRPDYQAIIKTMNLELKEFAKEIWRLNKEDTNPNIKNKKVGEISQTTVSGKTAYQFTLTESYIDDKEGSGYTLNKESLYLFVENNGLNFIIWFSSDDQIAQQILSTFKFTK